MTDVVAQAKAALEGLVEGPWEAQQWEEHARGDRGCGILAGIGIDQRGIAYTGLYRWNSQAEAESVAGFIVAARTLVPELVAEVERLTPRRIETAEELDALPDFTVLRDRVQTVWEKEHHGNEGPWWRNCSEKGYDADAVRLPAFVLWTPDGAK